MMEKETLTEQDTVCQEILKAGMPMDHEDIYDLLVYFLKVGRAVGITLLLHSDECDGIQKTLGTDMSAQFTSIHISEDKHADDVTIHFANDEYHACTVIGDRV